MRVRSDRMLGQIERLYDERLDYFVQVARAITGDRERACEAVQEAFASVVKARGTFRGDGPLEAFVWRAVVNAARKATRRPLVEVHELERDELVLPEESARLAPLVAALPERQRLVVFLRYYADLDYAAIGTILGIEPGTVGPTLAAAHAALRKSLSKEVRR
ncbi:MAG TPA: sigma-70 family RNA polymerase sigma factor [Gaiellaceae bacterium]|jgi:RNA polymerase sigma-70 factor (ECF subfamily)|nr:sigma-70 family RNA polymerase sigma factor [Gaiellaceae bacterium]